MSGFRKCTEAESVKANETMKCPRCDGFLKALACRNNPSASELYCSKCHVSYQMSNRTFQSASVPGNPTV